MRKDLHIFNYSFQNSASRTVDIYIDGEIVDAQTQSLMEAWWGDDTSVSFRSFRNSINSVKKDTDVFNVHINSIGGHVGDALAMHDYLQELQREGKIVNTLGEGIVASSATLILLAGNKPKMSANSWFMIHTVSGGIFGNVKQIENYAITMRKFNTKIVDLFKLTSSLSTEEIEAYMEAETFFTAQEAKNHGFISEITGEISFKNSIKKENWSFANTAILNIYNKSVVKPDDKNDDMKKFFSDLRNEILNAVKGIDHSKAIDNSALVNLVAEAIATPIEKMGDTMENAISDAVKAVDNSAAINTAVTAAIKPYVDKETELQTAITNLKTELTALKGRQTVDHEGDKGGETPIGAFN